MAMDEPAARLRALLRLAPGDGALRLAYAEHLHAAGDAAGAARVLTPALAARPDWPEGCNLMGMARFDEGDIAAAISLFRRAALLGAGAGAWSNLGMALKTVGRFDDALAAHDRAVALRPDDPQLRLNRAIALLRAGRMREAWDGYECRHLLPSHAIDLPLERLLPGLDNLAGRTVLVSHEEGFGDTLLLARYLPLLRARGARVVARVPRELGRLFRANPDLGDVVDIAGPVPSYDWHCPFFSLPRAFATTLETIPWCGPYIAADPALATAWAARLPRGRKVGLVWAGQARPWLPGFVSLDRRRSIALAHLAPLAAVPGIVFISLQKGRSDPPTGGLALLDPMPDTTDFADTAAIAANLDAVVSVDTAVAHLAAAMGRPLLLLDRYDNCWRWFSGREDSPWYPSLRILRQPRPGDWATPVARAAALLSRPLTAVERRKV
jgi:tetratricopeptide (TPR) repeat protein